MKTNGEKRLQTVTCENVNQKSLARSLLGVATAAEYLLKNQR